MSATRKPAWNHMLNEDYLTNNLTTPAKEALDAVNAGSHPCYNVSWTDLFAIFGNSRQLVREANRLGSSADRNLQIMIDMMRESHARLRRVLFLVAIEKLFDCGSQNANEVLWIYGEQLELANMISEHLTETDKETAQVKAHFDACV